MSARKFASVAVGGVLAAALSVVPFVRSATPAVAAGDSTPGVTVTAINPSGLRGGGDMQLALTAHSESSAVPDASCRPQEMTLDCWGSLVLRLPRYGDISVGDFEVHRVAVGDISCGDMGGDDGGCGDAVQAAGAVGSPGEPVEAQVNGVGVVKWSGSTGLGVGTKVQLKFTLTDSGGALYADEVVVQLSLFVEGQNKPLLYEAAESVQQVQIRYEPTP